MKKIVLSLIIIILIIFNAVGCTIEAKSIEPNRDNNEQTTQNIIENLGHELTSEELTNIIRNNHHQ